MHLHKMCIKTNGKVRSNDDVFRRKWLHPSVSTAGNNCGVDANRIKLSNVALNVKYIRI